MTERDWDSLSGKEILYDGGGDQFDRAMVVGIDPSIGATIVYMDRPENKRYALCLPKSNEVKYPHSVFELLASMVEAGTVKGHVVATHLERSTNLIGAFYRAPTNKDCQYGQ